MGLLDNIFGSEEGRLGIGLLAAAMPSNVPQGQRLMGVLAQQDAWKQSQMDNKLMQAQLDDRTMQTQARRAQQEAAMRKQQAIPSLFSQSDATGGAPGGVGGFNVQAAIAAGFDPEEIQKYAALQNLGRQEVARTIETTDAQGRPITVQLDKFGGRIGEGMGAWKAPVSVNQGDRTTFVDPATMQQRGSFGVNMSPGERDASARGWASNALARQRLSFDQSGGAGQEKPQYKDGQWVMPPRGMLPGQSIPAMPPTGVRDANEALAIINQARKIIPKATGSYAGVAADHIGRAFGGSTDGDIATGQLQALEGALVARMPKMSGPQSDKDVALYKQMAGVIGDPTIPRKRKLAALQTVEEIQRRYAGPQQSAPQTGGASGGWDAGGAPSSIPKAAINDLKMRGPGAKAQFDEVFGAGAADRVLGGR